MLQPRIARMYIGAIEEASMAFLRRFHLFYCFVNVVFSTIIFNLFRVSLFSLLVYLSMFASYLAIVSDLCCPYFVE